ncbi:MAG: dihydropteroate synthase [Deltaproteobacteria bacterium]|nr:dihydropteroate synthase [Deltaproteobacteria bacterium]
MTSEKEALDALKQAEVDPYGIQAMLPKMFHLNIAIDGLECRVANIIKQEMLSLGGDAAVARGTVACSVTRTDVILMGTLKQMQRFAEKISAQPFGLGAISERLRELLKNVFADSFLLRTARREIILGKRTLIMGIINVTPDSFSDGGRFDSPEKAVEEGIRMAEEGADILDIGGESTRPGSDPVSPEEEMRRVIPVIRALASRTDLPLSVDTMKASVARKALEEGAEIVNDVSAMGSDEAMAKIVADAGAAVVLMHMRGMPKSMQAGELAYHSLRGEIIAYLRKRIERAGDVGIDPTQIMVDPGLGFGKTAEDNMRLIRYLREFRILGRPILVGASRKAFIGRVTGGTPVERGEGTAAAVTAAILNGGQIIRVHDVPRMKKVAAVADSVLRA